MKKTAIIIINYNGFNLTKDCLESICDSQITSDYKVIVVDNDSKKDEISLLKEIYPQIIGIRSKVNGGFSNGNNLAIKYAIEFGCENFILLNNDTIVDEHTIQMIISSIGVNNIVVPRIFYYDLPNVIWYDGGYINKKTGNARHYNMGKKDTDIIENDKIVNFATGCCMGFSKSVLDTIGLLDDKYFMYCEDADFSIRADNAKVKFDLIREAKVWHKVSSSTGGSNSAFCDYYLTRNRLNYVKEYNNYFSWTAYPFSLISRIFRLVVCKKKENRKAFLIAILDHIKGKTGKSERIFK